MQRLEVSGAVDTYKGR